MAVAIAGCGPSDQEQFAMVEGAVERCRAARPETSGAIRAAADHLASLPVEHEKARAARDACAEAEYQRAEFHELNQSLVLQAKSGDRVENPVLIAERYKRMDELQSLTLDSMRLCSQRILEMPSGSR